MYAALKIRQAETGNVACELLIYYIYNK